MPEDNRKPLGEDSPHRKEYVSPQLVTYGNIAVITQAVMGGMDLDVGGMGANNKT